MTPSGKQAFQILLDLETDLPNRIEGFTAREITEIWEQEHGLIQRSLPVMTVSSYLTHLKHHQYVSRVASSDKTTAWWKTTAKGRKKFAA